MSFDLYVFPVTKALSDRAAARHVMRLIQLDFAPDKVTEPSVAAFLADFRQRYPDLDGLAPDEIQALRIPVTVDAFPTHLFLSVWWEAVGDVAPFALELTERHGLALFDPQAGVVHLPPTLGQRRPVAWLAAQRQGEAMLHSLTDAVTSAPMTGDLQADAAVITRQMLASGMRMTDIFGNEIRPDNVERMVAHPPGLPAEMQAPKQRARLFADLGHANPQKRSMAAMMASAWDPDPEITVSLRRLLADDPDIGVRSTAALSLGSLRDVESFGPVLDLARDLTEPSEKAASDHALSVARALIDLAPLVGATAVAAARIGLERLAERVHDSWQRRELDGLRRELDARG